MAPDISPRDAEFHAGGDAAARRRGSFVAQRDPLPHHRLYRRGRFLGTSRAARPKSPSAGPGVPSSGARGAEPGGRDPLRAARDPRGAVVEKDHPRAHRLHALRHLSRATTRAHALRAAAARLEAEVRGAAPDFSRRAPRPARSRRGRDAPTARASASCRWGVEIIERSLALVTQTGDMSAPAGDGRRAPRKWRFCGLRRQHNGADGRLDGAAQPLHGEAQSELTRTQVELSRWATQRGGEGPRDPPVLRAPVCGVVKKSTPRRSRGDPARPRRARDRAAGGQPAGRGAGAPGRLAFIGPGARHGQDHRLRFFDLTAACRARSSASAPYAGRRAQQGGELLQGHGAHPQRAPRQRGEAAAHHSGDDCLGGHTHRPPLGARLPAQAVLPGAGAGDARTVSGRGDNVAVKQGQGS